MKHLSDFIVVLNKVVPDDLIAAIAREYLN